MQRSLLHFSMNGVSQDDHGETKSEEPIGALGDWLGEGDAGRGAAQRSRHPRLFHAPNPFDQSRADLGNPRRHETQDGTGRLKGGAGAIPQELAQIDPATGLHLFGDELLIKAREAMLHAVQGYNNPRSFFKAETFIVTAVIAWTYLLHYCFKQKGVDYRYHKKVDGKPEVVKTKHGADKHWELTECLAEKTCPLDEPTKANLRFLIGIRHEIEHQMTRRIDDTISAKLQACCLNFNRALKELVGERYGLEGDLSFSESFREVQTV
jgi:hypothetical protein